MKTYIGLFILVIVLVAFSGCTAQQAKPAVTTAIPATTAAATEVPTLSTPMPTTVSTTVPTAVPTTAAAPVASANVTTAATAGPDMTPSTKVTTIHIRNNTFVPDQLTVLPGTGITWINNDAVTHVVKASGDSAGKFTSSPMVNGASFIYTFGETTGTYEFMDPAYPDMKGTIFVKNGDSVVGAPTQISS
jgi:plastocyanin